MSNFLTSSIGKKVIMSLSGLFLISFLCVHLSINLMLLAGDGGDLFNMGAHFMTNPIIKVIEPILGLGFVIHILWAFVLTIQNRKARPVRYAVSSQSGNASWQSRNMFVLGGLILVFLAIHIMNFWVPIKITGVEHTTVDGVEMHNAYALVSGLLTGNGNVVCGVLYCALYLSAAVLLGFHLAHGFWSAFQSVGFSNNIWRDRLEKVAYAFAILIGGGFAIIPIYFLCQMFCGA